MAHRPMESHSAMCAPPLLALAVSADAVFTLTLTLLSCEGPMWDALLPSTPNLRLRFAAGLGDLLALMLLRDLSAMLPLLEGGLALSRAGAAIIALVNAGVIAALAVKAGLALQMSAPAHKTLDLPEAGVQIYVPLLLVAELLGIAFCLFYCVFTYVNRDAFQLPAASSFSELGLHEFTRRTGARPGGPRVPTPRRRSFVARWLNSINTSITFQQPPHSAALDVPLLQPGLLARQRRWFGGGGGSSTGGGGLLSAEHPAGDEADPEAGVAAGLQEHYASAQSSLLLAGDEDNADSWRSAPGSHAPSASSYASAASDPGKHVSSSSGGQGTVG